MSKTRQRTWGRHASWVPEQVICPRSLEELQKAIEMARVRGLRVRAKGDLHSMNPICATEDLQVSMNHLTRVLWIDRKEMKVKVQAGIFIKDLLRVLAKEELTLPNQGYIVEQSIAGAIATATHGSGRTGTLSSFVEEIELVDGLGRVHVFNPYVDPHLFSAAVVNLGCLGVVYSVTLRCIPLSRLRLTKYRMSLSQAFRELPQLLQSKEHVQLGLDPYSDDTIVWSYEKTLDRKENHLWYGLQWCAIKVISFVTFDLKLIPSFALPTLLRIYFVISPFKSCVDDSYKILSPADEGHYIEEEIALPVEQLELGLEITQKIIQSFHQHRNVALILIRFASPDPYGYLSPALGRPTGYISLITIARKGYRELFRAVENALYPLGGRPHWGKVHQLTREKVAELYCDDYKLFIQAKRQLDPDRMFSNAYITDLF